MLIVGGRIQASSTLCNGLDSKAPLKNSLGNLWKTCPMLPQRSTNSTACIQVNLILRCRPGVLKLCRISFSLFYHLLHTFLYLFYPSSLVPPAVPTFHFCSFPLLFSSFLFSLPDLP